MKANTSNRQKKINGNQQQAVKIFTDREDPQEAFERKLRRLSQNEAWKEDCYVLSYYGIGGIGKTSLLHKLCRVIKGVPGNDRRLPDPIDCHYFLYDFAACEGAISKLSILLEWRRQLGMQNPKFKFFQFDAAVVIYGKKTGKDLKNNSTVSSLLESTPWLAQFFSAVDSISDFVDVPGLSLVTKVLKAAEWADHAVKAVRNKDHQAVLREMSQMEPGELLNNLHNYFARDMEDNMTEIAKKPVVIFLDTYERFVDAENQERVYMKEDHWLRKGSESVIKRIPGILWVIAGREKLRWSEDDEWDEGKIPHALDKMTEEEKEALAATDLEQHRLGDLSFADATMFLKAAGVRDETLWAPIYELTQGTPLYLDICVNTHQDLVIAGKIPTMADFGKNVDELIVRFLKGLNDQNQEMVCFLACLGSFTDEIVFEIANAAKNELKYYDKSRYRKFLLHSFIVPCEDGSYYVHETVRTAALKKVDEELAEEIYQLRLERLQKRVQNIVWFDVGGALADYVAVLIEAPIRYALFEEHLRVILEILSRLADIGEALLQLQLSETLFHYAQKKYPETTVARDTMAAYGRALNTIGQPTKTLDLLAGTSNGLTVRRVDGKNVVVPDDVSEVREWASFMVFSAENNKAWQEQYVEQSKRERGEADPETLTAMVNLSSMYRTLGKQQAAFDLRKRVFEVSSETWGEDHPTTLWAMRVLAESYIDFGEPQEALQLQNRWRAHCLDRVEDSDRNRSLSEFLQDVDDEIDIAVARDDG